MLKWVTGIVLLLSSVASFGVPDFIAGKDYEIISRKTTPHKKTVRVTEFFNYGCPWCYKLEPALTKWVAQKGNKIAFQKIPVIFNKDWEYYARAYYTAQALAINSKFNPLLFKAILEDKQTLNSSQAMIDFFAKNGVNLATAQSAFNHSPSIDLDIAMSQRLMAQYQIQAVPAFVVNNQFKTDLQMAKTEKRLFDILDFLITQDLKT